MYTLLIIFMLSNGFTIGSIQQDFSSLDNCEKARSYILHSTDTTYPARLRMTILTHGCYAK